MNGNLVIFHAPLEFRVFSPNKSKHDNIEKKKLEKNHWSYMYNYLLICPRYLLPTIVNLLLVSEKQTKHSTIERENIEF